MSKELEPIDLYMRQTVDYTRNQAPKVSATDYAPAITGTSILKGNGSGGFASAVSAKEYIEAKRVLRGYLHSGITEPLQRNLEPDLIDTDYVPLTMYVDGVPRVVGKAKIEGDLVIGHLDSIAFGELKDVVENHILKAVTVALYDKQFKGDYPGGPSIPDEFKDAYDE
jgi:hypothetical protein